MLVDGAQSFDEHTSLLAKLQINLHTWDMYAITREKLSRDYDLIPRSLETQLAKCESGSVRIM